MGALHFSFSISAAVFFGPLEESPCSLWQPPSLQYIGEWEWTVTKHLLWHFSAISPSSGFLCIFALFPTEDSLFILLSCFLSPMKRVVSLDSELTFKALCFTSTFCPSIFFVEMYCFLRCLTSRESYMSYLLLIYTVFLRCFSVVRFPSAFSVPACPCCFHEKYVWELFSICRKVLAASSLTQV